MYDKWYAEAFSSKPFKGAYMTDLIFYPESDSKKIVSRWKRDDNFRKNKMSKRKIIYWISFFLATITMFFIFALLKNSILNNDNDTFIISLASSLPLQEKLHDNEKTQLADNEQRCDNYEEIQDFEKPIPVIWTAKLDGCLVSCYGASFTRVPSDRKYPHFAGYYPDVSGKYNWDMTSSGELGGNNKISCKTN